jgi:hypothetical protein
MKRELRIIFEGIVAIGPPYPRRPPNRNDGPLFAVMPRIARHESRYTKTSDAPPAYIPAHIPVIFTDLVPMPATRLPDDTRLKYRIWYPVRERTDLSFSEDAEPKDLRYYRGTPTVECPINQEEENPIRDIAYVSEMREVWPARRTVDRGMLSRQSPVDALVAAQFFVPSGCVGSHGEDLKKNPALVTFLPPRTKKPVSKEILPQVVVTVRTSRVTLNMVSLDRDETLDGLVFDLNAQPGDVRYPYELRIANADPHNIAYVIDFLSGKNPVPLTGVKPMRQGPYGLDFGDIDFESNYEVFSGPDDGKALPIPWVPSASGERNCNAILAEAQRPGGCFAMFRRRR